MEHQAPRSHETKLSKTPGLVQAVVLMPNAAGISAAAAGRGGR